MKNALLVLAALTAVACLSACNYFDSPEAVLGSAYTDLQKNDLKAFRETLTGKALASYGNADAMAKLRAELAGLQLKTGEKQYLGGEKHTWRHYTYHYSLDVLGRPNKTTQYSRLKTAAITCEWYRGHTGTPHDPTGGTDTPDSEDCIITDLN